MSNLVVEEEIAEEVTSEAVEVEAQAPEETENVDNVEAKDGAEEASTEPSETEETEELEISIGDESLTSEKEEAPNWVKEVRKQNRELAKRNKELEQQNAEREATKAPTLGKKPTLEDYDYDSDKYEAAYGVYLAEERKVKDYEAAEQNKNAELQKGYQKKLDNYTAKKQDLKVKDFDEVEDAVRNTLDVTQQTILVEHADNPALLVYAIGKKPEQMEALSKIKDPVQFAFAAAKLEKDLKVTKKRKPSTQPEQKVNGAASTSGAVNSTLEKLREEAARTGEYSKVANYKKKHNL